MMTRKHFVLIADILKELGEASSHCFDSPGDRVAIARVFGRRLLGQNDRFDMDIFVKAATLEGDEEEDEEKNPLGTGGYPHTY